jgi:hypothetical protein
LDLPAAPITGWEKITITGENASDMAKNIPSVTSGVIFTFQPMLVVTALTRGYTHWASG